MDRHTKLRNVDLEHGHVFIVKHHNVNYLQKGESNTNIAYKKIGSLNFKGSKGIMASCTQF